jgi:hypothetical protein
LVNHSTSGDIGHTLHGQALALFFLAYPGSQGLLDDPGSWAIESYGQVVNLFGQWQRHMGSKHFRIHRLSSFESDSILVIQFS